MSLVIIFYLFYIVRYILTEGGVPVKLFLFYLFIFDVMFMLNIPSEALMSDDALADYLEYLCKKIFKR